MPAQIPKVQVIVHAMVAVRKDFGSQGADRVQPLVQRPIVQLEIQIQHRQSRAPPPKPFRAAGHACRQIQQAPGLVALARATHDHLAPLVQYTLDDLRRWHRRGLSQLPPRHDGRERRRNRPKFHCNIKRLAHWRHP